MAKDKKTVWKGFDYLQCDDFAAYLGRMAAQGWHFKEWGAGLVFERGEPETAVYCVEVFTGGSDYDTRPQPNTLEFAEYCEAAGWKLVDAKRKFCIFKRIRADAVDILTPRERVKNTFRAAGANLGYQLGLFAFMMLLQWGSFLGVGFENRVFSHSQMGVLGMVTVLFFLDLVYCIWFCCQKRRMMMAAGSGGEVYFGRFRWIGVHRSLVAGVIVIMVAYLAAPGDYGFLVSLLLSVGFVLIVSLLIAKFRPETHTNVMIGVVFGFVMVFVVMIVSMIIVLSEEDAPAAADAPLKAADIGIEIGEPMDYLKDEQSNLLGSHGYYSFAYRDLEFGYEVYYSEHEQILDRIWNTREEWAVNNERTDCTAAWGADTAFRNGVGDYYVCYGDAVLILWLDEDMVLSQQQIDTVRDRLDLR